MHSPTIRPRSAIEIVDAAVSLYRQNFKTMAVIGLAASLPILPVVAIAGKAGLFAMGNNPQQFMAFTNRFLPLMLLFSALAVLWFSVVDGAMTFAAAEAYHGRAPSPADAIRGAWGKGLSLIAGNLLRFLIIVGVGIAAALAMAIVGRLNGFLAFIIGVTVFVLFAHLLARTFAITSAIVIENRSATAGVQRSFSLSKNATLRIVGVALLCMVIYWVAQMVLIMVVQLLMQLIVSNPLVAALIGNVAGMVIYPFLNIAIMVLYYDQRVRKEGYDLDVMGSAIAAPAIAAQ